MTILSICRVILHTLKCEDITHPSTKYDFNVSIISESAGIVSMKLNSSVSNNIKPGRYQYDVELRETSTGNVTRIVEGQVEITAGITRRLTR